MDPDLSGVVNNRKNIEGEPLRSTEDTNKSIEKTKSDNSIFEGKQIQSQNIIDINIDKYTDPNITPEGRIKLFEEDKAKIDKIYSTHEKFRNELE